MYGLYIDFDLIAVTKIKSPLTLDCFCYHLRWWCYIVTMHMSSVSPGKSIEYSWHASQLLIEDISVWKMTHSPMCQTNVALTFSSLSTYLSRLSIHHIFPHIYPNIRRNLTKVYSKQVNTTKDNLTADRRAVRLLTSPCVGHLPFAHLSVKWRWVRLWLWFVSTGSSLLL